MRHRTVSRAPSQDVCIFCATKLAGQAITTSSRAAFTTYGKQSTVAIRKTDKDPFPFRQYGAQNPEGLSRVIRKHPAGRIEGPEEREIRQGSPVASRKVATELPRIRRIGAGAPEEGADGRKNRLPEDPANKAEHEAQQAKKKLLPNFLSTEQPKSRTTESGWGGDNSHLGAVRYGTKDEVPEPAPAAMPEVNGYLTRRIQLRHDSAPSAVSSLRQDKVDLTANVGAGVQNPAQHVTTMAAQQNPSNASLSTKQDAAFDGTIISQRGTTVGDVAPSAQSHGTSQHEASEPRVSGKPSFGMGFGVDDSPYQPPDTGLYSAFNEVLEQSPANDNRRQASSLSSLARTGYRARVLDSQHTQKPALRGPVDNWPHFQKRQQPDSVSEPLTASEDQQAPEPQKPIDIDQIFERHRSTREKLFGRRPNTSQSERTKSSRFTARLCALCGQRGHAAQDCPTKSSKLPLSDSFVRKHDARWDTQYEAKQSKDSAKHETPVPKHEAIQTYKPAVSKWDATNDRTRPAQSVSDLFDRNQEISSPRAQHAYRLDMTQSNVRDLRGEPEARAPLSSRSIDNEAEGREDRLSAFEEAKQRMLRSSRFSNAPVRQERPSRRRSNDDDDDYYGRDEIDDVDAEVLAAREARKAEKQAKRDQDRREREAAARNREAAKAINLPEYISMSNLAQALGVHYDDFINKLERLGYDDVFPGKILNSETSAMIAMEYGFDPLLADEANGNASRDLQAQPIPEGADLDFLPARPPVVTIMGHVDHGKTTILDYLRNASVAAGEAGGITQHIGAFSVALEATGRTITFLDTPGHAAFLAMRQRGANVTDIVVLVVAADDSVKPQTLEALKHARAANVPIIVAINKVDKPEADVQRVKNDLGRHGVEIEDFGGDTQVIEVSGKTGKGMDDLEEAIVAQSDILDHRADTEGVVEGWVLEATTKPAGRVATVLVRRGTLKVGSILVAGRTWTRVRSLRNDNGKEVHEATPGIPVEIDGWRDQPAAGDEVLQAETEQKATAVVEYRVELSERKKLAEDTEAINEARMLEQAKRDAEKGAADHAESSEQQSGPIKVPFVIKADVSGSAEAIEAYIMSVSSPLVIPQILYASVGQINENDIELASVANGAIIAFNLASDQGMKALASSRDVRVLEHNIIYRVLDEVRELLSDKLPPLLTQKVLGEAEVSQPFEIGVGGRKKIKIAGCKVRNGVVAANSRVRVMRNMVKVYDGKLSSLKSVKKDVQEMRKGSECGLAFDTWEGFEVGDLVQTYQEISEKRTL